MVLWFCWCTYPIELEIKDTTDTDRSASYLDIHLEIDSEGRLRKQLFTTKEMISIFPLWTFHLQNVYVATFQQRFHMEYISFVDWFCLFIYLWVLTFPLEDCSEFGNFVITLICSWSGIPELVVPIRMPLIKDYY